ncbi:MAG: hypothetical protein HKN16_11270 [Saprospiraceae bacterium]|nr:hypothetical protein [Saprospiraceae bacterium]
MLWMVLSMILSFGNTNSLDHDIHISKCIIEYSESDKAFQIMMHVFVDDLELALQKLDSSSLKLNTELEYEKADSLILDYLDDHFQIAINGKTTSYNYVGKEASEDLQAVWIYLEIPDLKDVNEVNVRDDMLTELYDDQTNIVQIRYKGEKRAYFLLTGKEPSDTVTF